MESFTFSTIVVTVLIFLLIGCIVAYLITRGLTDSKTTAPYSTLQKEQSLKEGYIGVPTDLTHLVGSTGVSFSVLRPAGKIKIGGKVYDAVSLNDFIDKDVPVKVEKYENAQLYVTPL